NIEHVIRITSRRIPLREVAGVNRGGGANPVGGDRHAQAAETFGVRVNAHGAREEGAHEHGDDGRVFHDFFSNSVARRRNFSSGYFSNCSICALPSAARSIFFASTASRSADVAAGEFMSASAATAPD